VIIKIQAGELQPQMILGATVVLKKTQDGVRQLLMILGEQIQAR